MSLRGGLSLVFILFLSGTSAFPAELGGTFNGMFLDALKLARAHWRPDACLAAFTYDFVPNGIVGIPTRDEEIYKYDFYSPSAPTVSFHASFSNRENWRPQEKTGEVSNSSRCISRMTITIDAALARARKARLQLGPRSLLEITRDRFEESEVELGRSLPPSVTECRICRTGKEHDGLEKAAATVPFGKELWIVAARGRTTPQGSDNTVPAVTSIVILDAEKGRVLRVKQGDPAPAVDARK